MKSRALPPQLLALAGRVATECTQCAACQARCAFLREHGTPKDMADRLLDRGQGRALAFECSLCGLCEVICPMRLPLSDFFLAMRRAALDAGSVSLTPYRALLSYETVGASRLFRSFHLPPGGDTVFFPGCTFPGTHPDTARALFTHLRERIPSLGQVMSCCFKPSHDLGRQAYFRKHFGVLRQKLLSRGIRTVLTACPNCYKVFAKYGEGLAVKTVFEVLAEHPMTARRPVHGLAIVHTPCPYRGQGRLQDIIRQLAENTGLEVEKTHQDGSLSACCGEGGAVGALQPELALTWVKATAQRAGGRLVVTSCAGCANMLCTRSRTAHLLDLLFFPTQTMDGSLPQPKGLLTYIHRLLFKWRAWRTTP